MITYQNMVITLMGYYYLFQAAKFWTSLVSIITDFVSLIAKLANLLSEMVQSAY